MSETLVIPRKRPTLLSFKSVPIDALFIADDNSVCQKVDSNSFNVIANSEGRLLADHLRATEDHFVKEILEIKNISFS